MVSLQDRFRGLMAGIVVGDCLGRPFEGLRRVHHQEIDGYVERNDYLPYSDDTALAMALTQSLFACDGFDGADMANRFVETWSAEPQRGYGGGVIQLFGKVKRGQPWDEAARAQFDGTGSYGNGGSMRVAPVALWAYPDLEATIELARQTATVTHTHPVGIEGAAIQAFSCHHALRDDFSADGLLEGLAELIETNRFKAKLDALGRALERDDDEYARLHLGHWVAADKSVLTAIYCFLLAEDFEDAIRRAIQIGGDTDTIAAMAGALAGALWGVKSVPSSWVVEGYGRMVAFADSMLAQLES